MACFSLTNRLHYHLLQCWITAINPEQTLNNLALKGISHVESLKHVPQYGLLDTKHSSKNVRRIVQPHPRLASQQASGYLPKNLLK